MRGVKVVYNGVNRPHKVGYCLIRIISCGYQRLSLGYCRNYLRIIGARRYEGVSSRGYGLSVSVNLCLMRYVEIIDNCVYGSSYICYGFTCVGAKCDLGLSHGLCRLDRRIISALERKSLGGGNYRLSVAVNFSLMRNIKIIDYRVYSSINSGYRIVGIIARCDYGICIRHCRIYRRVISLLDCKGRRRRLYCRRILIYLSLMRGVKIIDYRVNSRSYSRYGFFSIDAGRNERLSIGYCGFNRRIIGSQSHEGSSCRVDIRRVLIDLSLMRDVKTIDNGVDSSIEGCYGFR